MPRISTRPISPRRFCSRRQRYSPRVVGLAIGGPFAGRGLSFAIGNSSLPITVGAHAGQYVAWVWVPN